MLHMTPQLSPQIWMIIGPWLEFISLLQFPICLMFLLLRPCFVYPHNIRLFSPPTHSSKIRSVLNEKLLSCLFILSLSRGYNVVSAQSLLLLFFPIFRWHLHHYQTSSPFRLPYSLRYYEISSSRTIRSHSCILLSVLSFVLFFLLFLRDHKRVDTFEESWRLSCHWWSDVCLGLS